jgi:transcriptional regulator with XRE-family HTH domain
VKADDRIMADRLARRCGKNLRRLRREEGLSQESLGHCAGLHRTAIGMIENAQRTPRVDTLVKLAVALDRDPAELLRGLADELRPGRRVFVGAISLHGHSGLNKRRFKGRLPGGRALTAGRYALVVTATGFDGQRSQPATLRFDLFA